ncbi:ATP-binding protein [Paracoccus sp. CPCC 101403]|uniref:ATP-binding protein n=1 Tax=Paracoccus broussonetiae TaxID=3075834 RepID=A0ABU3ECQ5_9RHOB|nr:ATP-binding protein [Paracoccus sp. CPCC 101403]MDT1061998.1 ATP-binding protein [Paracoccus sp. CPCC 101403]
MTAMGLGPLAAEPAEWMHDAALLAVTHHLQASRTRPPEDLDPRSAWPDRAGEWQELVRRAAELPVDASGWTTVAALAAERFPDAAAAFSILADNPALHLPTPGVFARIAMAGLGLGYDEALAAALLAAGAEDGLELVPPAAASLPASQWGIRLSAEGRGRCFGRALRARGDFFAATHTAVMLRPARVAARILAAEGVVWVRSSSRRMARQLASDIASLGAGRGYELIELRGGEPVPLPDPHAPLLAVDLFALDAPPRIPPVIADGAGLLLLAPDRFDAGHIQAVDAPALDAVENRAVWDAAGIAPAIADALAPRFQLTLSELQGARREAELMANLAQDGDQLLTPPDRAAMAAAIRAAGARRMGPSVSNVRTSVTLSDLVAGDEIMTQLRDAVSWRESQSRVWNVMGLPRDAGEANGLTLLFSGPPGGGKTFAARCLANALGLNLYRTDLSQLVSKYIGETEKNLSRIFDEAEAGHGILFFDEADAVFGKRSDVKDAHDRYANIEVGFLLQRLENFGGVTILATNLRANLDPAFTRRMQFIIDFPMPQQAEREELWRRNLPLPDWREDDLDLSMLAERFRFAGGNIRNAAVAATHLAAAEGAPLGQRHLARAILRELEKSGLPRGAEDLGPLAQWLTEAR